MDKKNSKIYDHRIKIILVSKDGVREAVAVTQEAERIWLEPAVIRNTSRYTSSKYIATQNGVHRTFLGHPLYKQYDPTVRPW